MKASRTFPSFRAQIARWTLLLVGLVLAGVMLSAYLMVRQQKLELLEIQIKAFANRLPANPAGRTGMQRLEQTREWIFGNEAVYLSVLDADGRLIFRSGDWPDSLALAERSQERSETSLQADHPPLRGDPQRGGGPGRQHFESGDWHFETIDAGEERWRLATLTTANHTYHIAISLTTLDHELGSLRCRLFFILLPALGILAAGSWLIAGRAIRPLTNISTAAEKIVAGSSSERIEPAEQAPEIDRIIQLLNTMLDRLETNYRQALRFSADASHELKTPITLMQNALVNRLDSVTAESADARFCTEMLEHLSRIKRLTEGLLLLARADSGQLPVAKQTFDLAALCRDLVADLRCLGEAEDAGVHWQEEWPDSLTLCSDPSFVRTIIFNLLINAVRYSGRPAHIHVRLSREKDRILFAVSNNGPAIPASDKQAIFSRFYRGQNAASTASEIRTRGEAGSGLGLAIAHELALGIGGRLILAESREDHTRFEFSLPLKTDEASEK